MKMDNSDFLQLTQYSICLLSRYGFQEAKCSPYCYCTIIDGATILSKSLSWSKSDTQSEQEGWTPLHLACLLGDKVLVRDILKQDSELAVGKWKIEHNANCFAMLTPVMCAALAGSVSCLKYLLCWYNNNDQLFDCDTFVLLNCSAIGDTAQCFNHIINQPGFCKEYKVSEWLSEPTLKWLNEDQLKAILALSKSDYYRTNPIPAGVQWNALCQLMTFRDTVVGTKRRPGTNTIFDTWTLISLFDESLRKRVPELANFLLQRYSISQMTANNLILPIHELVKSCEQYEDARVAELMRTLLKNKSITWKRNAGDKEKGKTALNYAVEKKLLHCCSVLIEELSVEIHISDLQILDTTQKGYMKSHFDRPQQTF